MSFKTLNDLPTCKADGRLFLDFATTILNVAPKNSVLFCNETDYEQIVPTFKYWQHEAETTKEQAGSDEDEETKEVNEVRSSDPDSQNEYYDSEYNSENEPSGEVHCNNEKQ